MAPSRPLTGGIFFFVCFLLHTIVALVGISVATGGAADMTVWDTRIPRIYAVPLIHGPAGCASLHQMDSFDMSGRVPHAPCKNLSDIDLGSVAIHQEYVDFQGIDFDCRGHDVFVYPLPEES